MPLLRLFVCLAGAALAASAARGAATLVEICDLYHRITLQHLELAAQSLEQVQRDVAATGTDETGAALSADSITEKLRYSIRQLESSRDYFLKIKGEAPAISVNSTLSHLNSLDYFFWSAAGHMQTVQFEETYRTVWLISQRQRRSARALYVAHEEKAAALKRQYARQERELTAALARLQQESTQRERVFAETALREYDAATQRLLERRRLLCGILWSAEDFHRQAADTARADDYRKKIYGAWQADLAKLPRDSYITGGGIDAAVITHSNANTIDWLQLGLWFVKDIEINRQMNDAVRREGVESMRRRGPAPLPPVRTNGSEVQAMCQLLTARLEHYFRVHAQQRAVLADLTRLAARARALPRDLPDPAPLRAALAKWEDLSSDATAAVERRQRATEQLRTTEETLARNERELAAVREQLRLDARTLRPVREGGRPAADLLRERRQMLENYRVNKASADSIRAREEAVRAVETAITAALAGPQRARDSALAARDGARTALAAIPASDHRAIQTAWAEVYREVAQARDRLPEAVRRTVPSVPPGFALPADAAAARQALKGLMDATAANETARAELRRDLADRLAASERNDAELVSLGQALANLRVSAALTAETALKTLGAPDTDPAWEVFTRLRDGIKETKDLLEPGAGRLDKLEKVRAKLTGTKEGADLIAAAKEHLGTVGDVLSFLGTQGERLEKLRAMQRAFDDPRTALDGLSQLLQHTGDAIEGVPVVGQTVGPALSLYARIAAAAGQAAIRIQNLRIEQALTLFVGIAPERHLYVMDEIPESIPTVERERVLTMLQTRRLVALIAARTAEEARNAPYRVR